MDLNFKQNIKPKTIKFDDWMDIKKDSFGGPKETVPFTKDTNDGWARQIERNKDFENGKFNQNSDAWWRAMDQDVISRSTNTKTELSDNGKLYYGDGKAKSSMEDFIKGIKKES